MICAIMQPTYLPWIGYFELMNRSDIFVLFDDVQFVKKSWHHRNKIKSNDNELMLSIPVKSKGKRGQNINEVELNNIEKWKQKHLKSIELNYKKSKYFSYYFPLLKTIYKKEHVYLFDFTKEIILFLKNNFNITTKIICSSEFKSDGKNEYKVLYICKKINCNILYNTAGAKEFFNVSILKKQNIKVVFQKYNHPTYNQIGKNFLPYLSAIDLLFNEGQNSLKIISSGTS